MSQSLIRKNRFNVNIKEKIMASLLIGLILVIQRIVAFSPPHAEEPGLIGWQIRMIKNTSLPMLIIIWLFATAWIAFGGLD
jgi:hypothetical protein